MHTNGWQEEYQYDYQDDSQLFSSPAPNSHMSYCHSVGLFFDFLKTFHILINSGGQLKLNFAEWSLWCPVQKILIISSWSCKKKNMTAKANSWFWLAETIKLFSSKTTNKSIPYGSSKIQGHHFFWMAKIVLSQGRYLC